MRFLTCCMTCLMLMALCSALYAQSTGSHRVIIRVVSSAENNLEQNNPQSTQPDSQNQKLEDSQFLQSMHKPTMKKISFSTDTTLSDMNIALDIDAEDHAWDKTYSRLIRKLGEVDGEGGSIHSTDSPVAHQKVKNITYTVTEKN